jgi:hypothetical protein
MFVDEKSGVDPEQRQDLLPTAASASDGVLYHGSLFAELQGLVRALSASTSG